MVDKATVEIDIASTIPPGRSQEGTVGYIITTRTEKGVADAGDFLRVSATRNESLLIALEESLRRLNRPVSLIIRSEDGYIRTGCRKLEAWKENDWRTAAGKELKNAGHWKSIEELLHKHSWKLLEEKGEFTNWLKKQTERKGEKGNV